MLRILKFFCLTSLLVGTPLLGMLLSGSPLKPYLSFPPTTTYAEHNSFSWVWFAILSMILAGVLLPFMFRFFTFSILKEKAPSTMNYPWWGWGGLESSFYPGRWPGHDFNWFQPFQDHTFTPLWIGYILVINALCVKRTGQCFLTEKPLFYLNLFPISAVFWWTFEFLNQICTKLVLPRKSRPHRNKLLFFCNNSFFDGLARCGRNEPIPQLLSSFAPAIPQLVEASNSCREGGLEWQVFLWPASD